MQSLDPVGAAQALPVGLGKGEEGGGCGEAFLETLHRLGHLFSQPGRQRLQSGLGGLGALRLEEGRGFLPQPSPEAPVTWVGRLRWGLRQFLDLRRGENRAN